MFEALADNPTAAISVALVLGLLIGSFLNVVILRLPRRLEWRWKQDSRELLEMAEQYDPAPPGIVIESSHCPQCNHKLAAWENIPLLSFALLRGKCRVCAAPISWQYPAVELITGVLFALCVWRYGVSWQSGAGMLLSAFLVALAGIDLRTTLLPDQLTLPLLWLGLLAGAASLFVGPVSAILGAAAGYLSLWSVYWLFKLVTGKEGMGYGDFKLLAMLGAWGGWQILPLTILLSSLVGAVLGVIMLRLRNAETSTPIPFGPYLAIAGWIALLWGEQITASYLQIAGFK